MSYSQQSLSTYTKWIDGHKVTIQLMVEIIHDPTWCAILQAEQHWLECMGYTKVVPGV